MLMILAATTALAVAPNLPSRFDLACRGRRVTVGHGAHVATPFIERYAVDLPRQIFVRASTRRSGRVMASGPTNIVFTDEKSDRPEIGAYEMYENLAHKLFSQRRSANETVTVDADCTVLAPRAGPGRRR